MFKLGGSETLLSALVDVKIYRPRISVKRQVFSVLTTAYFRGPFNLKKTSRISKH